MTDTNKIKTFQEDERPPKDWWDACITGVKSSGSAVDPAKVCGNLFFNIKGGKEKLTKQSLQDAIHFTETIDKSKNPIQQNPTDLAKPKIIASGQEDIPEDQKPPKNVVKKYENSSTDTDNINDDNTDTDDTNKDEKNIKLKGGDTPDDQFDADQLSKGTTVELEHTDDPKIAKQIAKAHLLESPEYYIKLDEMETNLKKDIKSTNETINNSIKTEIIEYLKSLPESPTDEIIHTWAIEKGYDIETIEEIIYDIAKDAIDMNNMKEEPITEQEPKPQKEKISFETYLKSKKEFMHYVPRLSLKERKQYKTIQTKHQKMLK